MLDREPVASGHGLMGHGGGPPRAGGGVLAFAWGAFGVILGLSGWALTLSWCVEILCGITGLFLAGGEFAALVKTSGWKHAPKVAFDTFLHGHASNATDDGVDDAADDDVDLIAVPPPPPDQR